ncbi:hypothetical protein, partial [Hyphomicrobium sulfonivorans]|uniref:hypothetical protein n=1 Tax=Hyphomicrobium sulfonivorans TaxID=121290 RepID=UPI001AEC3D1A
MIAGHRAVQTARISVNADHSTDASGRPRTGGLLPGKLHQSALGGRRRKAESPAQKKENFFFPAQV